MRDNEFTYKSLLTKILLACSDLICFNAALFIALALINCSPILHWQIFLKRPQLKIATHVCLSLICTGWFWVRLRHYTYRKPFWFELKEIFRTILIFCHRFVNFSIITMADVRFVWVLTWILALVLIPLARAISKRVLNHFGMWKKQTIIIGSNRNAQEAAGAAERRGDGL